MQYVLEIDRALGELDQVPAELTDYTLRIHEPMAGKTWGPKQLTLNPAQLLADGQAARRSASTAKRLGNALRECLQPTDWPVVEAAISRHLDEASGASFLSIQILSRAVEIRQLPWELLTLRDRETHLGAIERVLVHYALPAIQPARPPDKLMEPRVLFAWSAAGGAIPHQEHQRALEQACQDAPDMFQPNRQPQGDIVGNVSGPALSAALQSEPPVSLLHLLCHGLYQDGAFCLQWRDPERGLIAIDPSWLGTLVHARADHLRVVVLCACDSGNAGPDGNILGSLAEALHRAGTEHVIAARYPLEHADSCEFTTCFYDQRIRERATVEAAFIAARHALIAKRGPASCAQMLLYSQPPRSKEPPKPARRPIWVLLGLLCLATLLAFPAIHEACIINEDALLPVSIDAGGPADAPPLTSIDWPEFGNPGGLALLLASSDEEAGKAWEELYQHIQRSSPADKDQPIQVQAHAFPYLEHYVRAGDNWTDVLNELDKAGERTNSAVIAMVYMAKGTPMLRIIIMKEQNLHLWPDEWPEIRLTDPKVQQELAPLLMTITAAATSRRINHSQPIPISAHADIDGRYKVLALALRSARGESLAEEHESGMILQNIVQACESRYRNGNDSNWQEALAEDWSCAQAYLLHVQLESNRCQGDKQTSTWDLEQLEIIRKHAKNDALKRTAGLLVIRERCRLGEPDLAAKLAKDFLRVPELPVTVPEHLRRALETPDANTNQGSSQPLGDRRNARRPCEELILGEIASCVNLDDIGLSTIEFQDFQHCPPALLADAMAHHANRLAWSGDKELAAETWKKVIENTDSAFKQDPANPHLRNNLAEYKLHEALAQGHTAASQHLSTLAKELRKEFNGDLKSGPHPPEVMIHRQFLLVRAFGEKTREGENAMRQLCVAYKNVAASDIPLCDRGGLLGSLAGCASWLKPNAATCSLYKALIGPKNPADIPRALEQCLR